MKNIRKTHFFLNQKKKKKKIHSVWPRGSNNQSWKEIRALGSEIIATRTDDGWTIFDFISSADI